MQTDLFSLQVELGFEYSLDDIHASKGTTAMTKVYLLQHKSAL